MIVPIKCDLEMTEPRTGRLGASLAAMVSFWRGLPLFVVGYVTQVVTIGHQRFPGDDWVRTLFLVILASSFSNACTAAAPPTPT